MSGGGAIGEWEETYRSPDRVTLVARPRIATIILGAFIGVLMSKLVLKTDTFDAWPSALAGGVIGGLIAVGVWLAKLDRLELDPSGVKEISWGRLGEHIPSSDCTMFMPGEPRARRWHYVGFNRYSVSAGYIVPGAMGLSLRSNYGLPLDQLINLMNAFRTRAAGTSP